MKEVVSKATEEYFKPRAWEAKVYRALGVVHAKRLVLAPWVLGKSTQRSRWDNYFIWDKSSKGLKSFEGATRFNEGIHVVGFLLGMSATSSHFALGNLLLGSGYAVFTLSQLYLVLIQRYNRSRLYSIIEAKEKREKVVG